MKAAGTAVTCALTASGPVPVSLSGHQIQNNSGPPQGLGSPPDGMVDLSARRFRHDIRPQEVFDYFDILTMASVCGLLFIAAIREVSLVLWSIPAMTLFADRRH